MKDRYYTICRRLVRTRTASDPVHQQHLIQAYAFDKAREIKRKQYASDLFHLTPAEIAEEEALYVEITRMQQNERRFRADRDELMRSVMGLDSGLMEVDQAAMENAIGVDKVCSIFPYCFNNVLTCHRTKRSGRQRTKVPPHLPLLHPRNQHPTQALITRAVFTTFLHLLTPIPLLPISPKSILRINRLSSAVLVYHFLNRPPLDVSRTCLPSWVSPRTGLSCLQGKIWKYLRDC